MKCAVNDGEGNHCPGLPMWTDGYIYLCDRCNKNVKDGAFNKKDIIFNKIS